MTSNGISPPRPAADIETPALVYDEAILHNRLQRLCDLGRETGVTALFSVKACPLRSVLEVIAPWVHGFSASSLFEARLAREVLADKGSVHLTSPALEAREIGAIGGVCDYVAFNSLGQWERLRPRLAPNVDAGVRINPQRSYVEDARYDPCRAHSKLGVPLETLERRLATDGGLLAGLSGIQFHNHHDSHSFAPLAETLTDLARRLPRLRRRIAWINLGGGYLVDDNSDASLLADAVAGLRRRRPLTVFFEPGKGVVGDAARLVATVVDVFDSGGRPVAVLDSSVNHLPEVFEYQRPPAVAEAVRGGRQACILAGGTCLAGDLFGEYAFEAPLEVGARVTFTGVGAYSIAKAHRFNGHNLPSIYLRGADGRLRLVKRYDYEDYRRQWC